MFFGKVILFGYFAVRQRTSPARVIRARWFVAIWNWKPLQEGIVNVRILPDNFRKLP